MSDETPLQPQANSVGQVVQPPGEQAPAQSAYPTRQQPEPRKKKKRHPVLMAIIWIVVILIVIILGLVISAYIAGFKSVFEMINWIIQVA